MENTKLSSCFTPLAAMLCISLFLSCTTTIEPLPPPPDTLSSSSKQTWGSSSSYGQSSSSIFIVASSSSNNVSYCNYGRCSQWSSDGLSCLMHEQGWPNAGGCYQMPTNDNCNSGTIVAVCPAGTEPPTVTNPSSSSAIIITGGKFQDRRDGLEYAYVEIGEQVWMAENLNYNASGSRCYDDDTSNCAIYGRLYNWATAMEVCPSGWHLPSSAEWDVLVNYAGGSQIAGTKLKSTSGWNGYNGSSGDGTDDYGFSALPGGHGSSDVDFSIDVSHGIWWSASEHSYYDLAYYLFMNYDPGIYWLAFDLGKSFLFSVRCVKN